MPAEPVIAIFDIGKTNKKLFLFNQLYKIVYEVAGRLTETVDEDGYPCEDVEKLADWVFEAIKTATSKTEFDIKAINFSAYGASLVHAGEDGIPVCPLYNYLKPYPEELQNRFYKTYGGEEQFTFETASPILGSLNSGMILYRLKYEQPALFAKIKYAFHLPQYICYLVTGNAYSDITSIGCHTNLWNFIKNDYHDWVYKEGINHKLPPIVDSTKIDTIQFEGKDYLTGVGLHDSSAALIPYLLSFKEPFILISTGTWCISLNPFNNQRLTKDQLACDCLLYKTYEGNQVMASRLFAGNEHEVQVKRLAAFYNVAEDYYKSITFSSELYLQVKDDRAAIKNTDDTITLLKNSMFGLRNLSEIPGYAVAYHQLIADIISQQYISTQLVLEGTEVKQLFVDGGFSNNTVYMNLLSNKFPQLKVYAASMAQATALGTALVMHEAWNTKSLPENLVELKFFAPQSPFQNDKN